MEIIRLIAVLVVGVLVGLLVRKKRPIGDLRVDQSDPTSEPILFLELDRDVTSVIKSKCVTFRVKVENYIPHK